VTADSWTPTDEPTKAPAVGDLSTGFRCVLDTDLARLPTVIADGGSVGRHWLAAASITGLGHQHHARTGQDSYAFTERGTSLVAAVTDGLGERPKTSQLGATAAARMLCDELGDVVSPRLWWWHRQQVVAAIGRASERLEDAVERFRPDLAPRDVATTAAFCVLSSVGDRSDAVVGRIGDCGAFTITNGVWSSVFQRDEGPTNIVRACLPSPAPTRGVELKRVRLDGSAVVVLTTDELANDIFSSPSIRDWLADRWQQPATTFHMIETLRYRRQGSHDDRTALVVWPFVHQAATAAVG